MHFSRLACSAVCTHEHSPECDETAHQMTES